MNPAKSRRWGIGFLERWQSSPVAQHGCNGEMGGIHTGTACSCPTRFTCSKSILTTRYLHNENKCRSSHHLPTPVLPHAPNCNFTATPELISLLLADGQKEDDEKTLKIKTERWSGQYKPAWEEQDESPSLAVPPGDGERTIPLGRRSFPMQGHKDQDKKLTCAYCSDIYLLTEASSLARTFLQTFQTHHTARSSPEGHLPHDHNMNHLVS